MPFAYSPVGPVSILELAGILPVVVIGAIATITVVMLVYRVVRFAITGDWN